MATYNNLATDNANVKFLTGTQASLDNLISKGGAVEGAFYLTEDTHRLYVGRTEGSKTYPVPVNEGVHIVATQNELEAASSASAGQMAYVSGDNILVINNGQAWVQLNPDTYLKANNNAVTVASSGSGKVTVTTSVSDSANHKASGIFNITSGSNVTVVSKGTDNEISIGAKDTTTALNFAQAGDDNENTDLNVTATVNNADGTNTQTTESTVTFKKGTNMDSIAYDDTAKTITFNATDQSVDSVSASFSNTGVLSVGVKDKTGGQKSATVTPTISYGNGSTKSTATFNSGVASLNIYTKEEVDAAIQKVAQDAAGTADAMTFRGVISSSDQLPNIVDAQNGDTYRIGANDITIGSWPTGAILNTPYTTTPSVIKAGDVLVAVGTEDTTTGKITSDGIWYLIPSGDDLQYSSYINDTVKDIAHGFELHDNSSALTTVVGARLENTDGSISLTDSVDASNGKIKVITVKQKDDYATQTLEATDSNYEQAKASGEGAATTEVKVIAGLAVDKYGNVTSATQETLKLVDSHANIKSVSSTLNVTDTAKAVINLTVTDTDNKSGTASINLGSDTLSFASTNGSLTANIKWGSF